MADNKTLYSSPGFRYGPDAEELAWKTRAAIEVIFKEYANMGYNPREIAHLMQSEVTDVELEILLSPAWYKKS